MAVVIKAARCLSPATWEARLLSPAPDPADRLSLWARHRFPDRWSPEGTMLPCLSFVPHRRVGERPETTNFAQDDTPGCSACTRPGRRRAPCNPTGYSRTSNLASPLGLTRSEGAVTEPGLT